MAKKLGFGGGVVKAADGLTKAGKVSMKVIASSKTHTPPVVGQGTERDFQEWAQGEDTSIKQRKVVSGVVFDEDGNRIVQSINDVNTIGSKDVVSFLTETGAALPNKPAKKDKTDKPATDRTDIINEALQTAK